MSQLAVGTKPKQVLVLLFMLYLGNRVVALAKKLLWRRRMNKKYPGPPGNILLGNLLDIHLAGGFSVKYLADLHEKYGPVFRLWMGPFDLHLSTTDYRVINEIHQKAPSRPKVTKCFLNFLGDASLVLQPGGEKVKRMRLKYGAIVNSKDTLDVVCTNARRILLECTAGWETRPEPVNVHEETQIIIYNIMGATFFGERFFGTEEGRSIRTHHLYCVKNVLPYGFLPFKPWFMSGFRTYERHRRSLHEEVTALLLSKKGENSSEVEGKGMNAILSDPFFDDVVNSRTIAIIGLMNGAFDTCYATFNWVVFFMSKHQQYQEELRVEVAKLRKDFVVEDLYPDKMPFLDAVFHETLRMRSTVPINQRINHDADFTVQSTGLHVPKGVTANLVYQVAFQDPAIFGEDAATFNPRRWKDESILHAWTPFGAHSRMCVGLQFGTTQLRVMVTALFRTFKTVLADPDATGEYIFEAGVSQPVRFDVKFERLGV
eukprot:GEMP01020016.1.p1 GENE.GEMP01020016.1~~GEMP01020016.1.p1  ORF type:complete len:487 (+),score=79.74 GEMP01020016.1:87-1547(+)